MTGQEKEDLSAAEYVLGLTDNPTRQQIDKRFNDDADFAAEVQRWQKAFSGIDVATRDITPSSTIWQRIEQDIKHNYTEPEATHVHRHPMFWLGWGFAAAMAGIVIFTNVIRPNTPHLQPIAVLSGTQPNAQLVVSLDKSTSIMQVSALNVTLPQNKNLQLWMIKGGTPPQSLGLIDPRDRNTFQLSSGLLDNQTVLAISLEPVGGSKQKGPSGPVIFQGKISAI